MYAGHAALAMFAKGVRPRISIAVLVPVAFAPDWVEWILAVSGRENRLVSHSLVSIAIAASVVALVYWAFSKSALDAAAVWLTYASHWPADFITGYKPTWPGGPVVGLGMYAHPVADIVIECVVILVCWLVYRRSLPPRVQRSSIAWAMPVGLMAMQIAFYAIQKPEVREQVREVIGTAKLREEQIPRPRFAQARDDSGLRPGS